jgi:hypothetical protein
VHYWSASTQISVGADTSLYKERPAKRSSPRITRKQRQLRKAFAPERLKSLAIRIVQGEETGVVTWSAEEEEVLREEYGNPISWAYNYLAQQSSEPVPTLVKNSDEIRARLLLKRMQSQEKRLRSAKGRKPLK